MDFFRGLFNKTPLTEQVINETVSDLITNGTSNPSNQEIAEKLGRNTDEVTAFRQGIKEKLPKYNFNPSFPRDQKAKWPFPIPPTMNGGRSKTNKNKKKHNKLSRRRRQPDSKKNRKSMKHK
jgi:hypothetical protein